MSGQKGSSKADTLVKVVLVFFISLLSFSVGTFVGKQVSDSDHRRMALEGEFQGPDRKVASVEDKADGDNEDKITEKEVESLTEEFVNKEKSREPAAASSDEATEKNADEHEAVAAKHDESQPEANGYKTYEHGTHGKTVAATSHKPAPTPPPAAKDKAEHATETHAKVDDKTHSVAEKVARNEAPSDGKKEARKPQSILPSVAGSAIGKYAVQVASYPEEKDAKSHAADLKGKGFTAFYVSANVSGKTYYRVLVGLFDNVKSADVFRAQLMKDIGTKSAIVQKIVQ